MKSLSRFYLNPSFRFEITVPFLIETNSVFSRLDNVLTRLRIQSNYDLLGQSWGGMLAASHAIRQPPGLHRLILADTLASMSSWVKSQPL